MIYRFKDIDKSFKYSGIYKINYPDGTFYIGKSINLFSRLKSHASINRYSIDPKVEREKIDNCTIEILEHHLNNDELIIREAHFILFYGKLNPNLIRNGLKVLPTNKTLTRCYYNIRVSTTEDFALQQHN